MAWDERKHPRVPKGNEDGGEFTTKPLGTLSAAKLNREMEIARAKEDRVIREMDEAGVSFKPGMGYGTFTAYRGTDPLGGFASRYRTIGYIKSDIENEMTRRYGPGHGGRLPESRSFTIKAPRPPKIKKV